MNKADVAALAWALADSAKGLLNRAERARVCAKIGAGEQDSAIADLLDAYANTDTELAHVLAAPIRTWIDGYAGSDRGLMLRRVYDRISVSAQDGDDSEPAIVESGCSAKRLVAVRSEHATRNCATRRTTSSVSRVGVFGMTTRVEELVDYAVEACRVARTATEVAVRQARSRDWSWERIAAALGGNPDPESLRRRFG